MVVVRGSKVIVEARSDMSILLFIPNSPQSKVLDR